MHSKQNPSFLQINIYQVLQNFYIFFFFVDSTIQFRVYKRNKVWKESFHHSKCSFFSNTCLLYSFVVFPKNEMEFVFVCVPWKQNAVNKFERAIKYFLIMYSLQLATYNPTPSHLACYYISLQHVRNPGAFLNIHALLKLGKT